MKNIKSIAAFESMFDDSISNNILELREIQSKIDALMHKANDLVEDTATQVGDRIIYERWKAYPYNNIMAMLSHGSTYDTGFLDIIDELEQESNKEDDRF
jgi:hypothetical protein